jgi:hypothetical protein
MRSLIFDITNLIFRVAAVEKNRVFDSEDLIGLCMHMSFMSVNKYFKKYQPDRVIFAFEGGWNWRKQYTPIRNVAYKGNRVKDPTMEHFFEVINSFKELCQKHSSVVCLAIDGCEADDSIAGYVQLHNDDPDHEIYIVSGDKDMTQLLKRPNTYLVNPDKGVLRNQPGDKEYYEDLDYFIFKKCVRGDGGDNVLSAYPNVRETKILKAYEDEFERENFMNTEIDYVVMNEAGEPETKKFKVGTLFEENKLLMDLTCQPPEVREVLMDGIRDAIQNRGKYSNFHFLKFLGKYELNKLAENVLDFTGLLTCNQNIGTMRPKREEPVKPSVVSEDLVKWD